nr:hypothetical protein [Tanacetum cinerariifolium]
MNKLVRRNLVRGLHLKNFENDHTCVTCLKGKQHKASCKTKLVSSIRQSLQMLHMDLFGLTFVKSLNKKMYCLVITDDFSRFSWVFFLASKDKTSGILKTFIIGIENQINHRVKIIRCDNRTEFKNSEMNQFCRMKGIKREFSVARTLQQNGVAKRDNRTLIENKVLVTKPYNKTPYKLLLGRSLNIDFMKPFGCHVTILNTLDHLGKFEGKADEGRGPEWLFDIDSLTISMNYEPVTTRNQTNHDASIEIHDNVGQARQEKASDHEYILLPFIPYLSTQSSDDKDADVVPGKGDEGVSKGNGIDDQEMTGSSTQDVNTAGPSINTTNKNINTGSLNINTIGSNDPGVPSLEETGIFDDVYDDREVGAAADINNLELSTVEQEYSCNLAGEVVTPLIDSLIKCFAAASAVLKLERLKVEKHGMSEPMSYYLID